MTMGDWVSGEGRVVVVVEVGPKRQCPPSGPGDSVLYAGFVFLLCTLATGLSLIRDTVAPWVRGGGGG